RLQARPVNRGRTIEDDIAFHISVALGAKGTLSCACLAVLQSPNPAPNDHRTITNPNPLPSLAMAQVTRDGNRVFSIKVARLVLKFGEPCLSLVRNRQRAPGLNAHKSVLRLVEETSLLRIGLSMNSATAATT